MLHGRKNALHRWNAYFMAQLRCRIVTFSTTHVDMGRAPTNQAMFDYIYYPNRRVLPQNMFVAIGMPNWLICNMSIE